MALASCRLERFDRSTNGQATDYLRDAYLRLEQLLPLLKPAALRSRTQVHNSLGQIALALHKNQQALSHFAAAASSASWPPGQPDSDIVRIIAFYGQALAFMRGGREDQARGAFARVVSAIIELVPDQGEGLSAAVDFGLNPSPTLGELLVDSRLSSAEMLAQRGADPRRVRQLVSDCKSHLDGLPDAVRARCSGRCEVLVSLLEAGERPALASWIRRRCGLEAARV